MAHRSRRDSLQATLVSSGAIYAPMASVPNGDRQSAYVVFGLAADYLGKIANRPTGFRMDLTNLTNVHYATSDAKSLAGGWTQWARTRALTIGIEQGF